MNEKFWDRTARHYDREERGDNPTYLAICSGIKGYLKPSDNVLDLGCGTGTMAIELSNMVKEVHGIDTSINMIRLAREKSGGLPQLKFSHGSLFSLNIADDSCDVILAQYVLHLVHDLPRLMERIYQKLKPGGVFISVTPCLGKFSYRNLMLSILAFMGVVPDIHTYEVDELVSLLTYNNSEILERVSLPGTGNEYLIVVRKRLPALVC